MKNNEYFSNFKQYEIYINKVTKLWSLIHYLYPELYKINGNNVFTFSMIDVINDEIKLDKEIKALEQIKKNNTFQLKNKYLDMNKKLAKIQYDFE
jgi:hypothetical protein